MSSMDVSVSLVDLPSLCGWVWPCARLGHVSWRAPYYDPMVKLPFQKFCRCKKLFIKVIWVTEFNGCVCSVIWLTLCGWVWLRHVLGTSPEGRPIMTQWSNWKKNLKQFCRCKNLHTKVIWDAEFNGCVLFETICRLMWLGMAKARLETRTLL